MKAALQILVDCGPLPSDLVATRLEVVEALSTPTRAVLHALSEADVDVEAAVLEKAKIAVVVAGQTVRQFHLVVTSARFDGVHRGRYQRYVFELEHELHLLTFRADVRMFQEKNAQEIVAEVLDAAQIPAADLTFSLQRTPSKRTYTVQYRETDFAFVSRLLEYEGIHYDIHDDDAGTHVTFADAQESFGPIDGKTTVELLDDDAHGEGIVDFALDSKTTTGSVTLKDYDFTKPDLDLRASSHVSGTVLGDRFDYPAGLPVVNDIDPLRNIRLEELLAGATIGTGTSEVTAFRAGAWFTLDGAGRDALNQKYLLRSVEHLFVVHPEEQRGESYYRNSFTCIPWSTRYRPPRLTPRPTLGGAHSVVVTGPSGAEIHTEEQGRMKGKFFWDRVGADDEHSSCWMRVTQLPTSGSIALARMTWEMAVAYFDGDPDRPIAVARLYNAEKTSPYGYPKAQTRMSFQTASSPASGKSNEIRMEDGGGGMEFFVNAAKDLSNETVNNKTEKVGVDDKLTVGVSCSETVGANQTIAISGSQTTSVGTDLSLNVKTTRSKSVGGSETVTVSGSVTSTVAASDSEVTGGSHTSMAALGVSRTAVGSHGLTVGGSMVSAAGLGCAVAVAGAKSETIGGVKLALSGASVAESIVGAYASTVGGVCVQAAAGKRAGDTKGPAAITVGGVVCVNAASKVMLKGKKVSITVAGIANLLGGGGNINLTPGSVTMTALVTLDASGGIKVSGNPNLVG
jgi:type VI secretion system secreted protein VgrG